MFMRSDIKGGKTKVGMYTLIKMGRNSSKYINKDQMESQSYATGWTFF